MTLFLQSFIRRSLILAVLILLLQTGCKEEPARILRSSQENVPKKEKLITLKNDLMIVGISPTDGTIRSLVNTEDTVDYCNQLVDRIRSYRNVPVGERICGVTVYDQLKKEYFSDLATSSKISHLKVEETDDGVACSFDKKFSGADFVIKERLVIKEDHLRWEVKAVKQAGADRSLRIVQFIPLPIRDYNCWAPIAEAPFESSPYNPFQITYGMMEGGAVGDTEWRTIIPMNVFYSGIKKNALCVVSPFEIPSIRVRFRNSIGIAEDFHWNSRNYSIAERPYLQVINEYLGLRDDRPAETGLLLTVQPGDWRPSLGWVYNQYREYFDPAPGFETFDGAYVLDQPYPDSMSGEEFSKLFENYYDLGVRWEEMHGHFPRYGRMIPPDSVKTWFCASHPKSAHTTSRARIKDHATRAIREGIGSFIYYNTTESEWWYAKQNYPEDIARDENGDTIGAFNAARYPDSLACWLMCSDPNDTRFGRDMISQAEEMLQLYPDVAGFFWDVYGRTYRFDFANDDGITMVNNKPAYFPMFMFMRMAEQYISPLLHSKGKFLTCNKPTMIQALKGIDGVMTGESTSYNLRPTWPTSQSYLGLNRHAMILDARSWKHPERLFLNCLRYGYFYSRVRSEIAPGDPPEVVRQKKHAESLRNVYHPIIKRFKGKKWVFHPRALSLPRMTDGNIFRLEDGSVMVTMISIWRVIHNIAGTTQGLELTCRLPDAGDFTSYTIIQPDLNGSRAKKITPASAEGEALTFKIPKHGQATVILLEK